MKILNFLIYCSLLPVLAGCSEYSLALENRSEYSVFYYSEFRVKRIDPDTIIRFTQADLWELESQKRDLIWMESNITICEYLDKINAGQVRIYIFHPDTLAKYSWEEIKAGHKVLQRYDLTRRDLQQLDEGFPEVPFPPDATIRNARMFPPYGTYSKGK